MRIAISPDREKSLFSRYGWDVRIPGFVAAQCGLASFGPLPPSTISPGSGHCFRICSTARFSESLRLANHAVNILLRVLDSTLVFLIFRRLTKRFLAQRDPRRADCASSAAARIGRVDRQPRRAALPGRRARRSRPLRGLELKRLGRAQETREQMQAAMSIGFCDADGTVARRELATP